METFLLFGLISILLFVIGIGLTGFSGFKIPFIYNLTIIVSTIFTSLGIVGLAIWIILIIMFPFYFTIT